MLFTVFVDYYNYKASDAGHYRDEISVFGRENAYTLGKKIINADNVLSVDVIDAMTGEIIKNWDKNR